MYRSSVTSVLGPYILIVSFRELVRRRDKRLPGFSLKYIYPEFWKVIIRLVLRKDTNLITFLDDDKLFLNLDKKSFSRLLEINSWNYESSSMWSLQKKNILNFTALYCPFILKFWLWRVRAIYFNSDINFANYTILRKLEGQALRTCVQHGYFPFSHQGDLDGLNSDMYIVRSKAQANLLSLSGYSGKTCIRKFNEAIPFTNNKIRRTVFVGPGFAHDPLLEEEVYKLVKDIDRIEPSNLFYRPHPRCSSYLIMQIRKLGVVVDNGDFTAVNAKAGKGLFYGVKSTMLLDAQEIGHNVILVEGPEFPTYFVAGEIEHTIKTVDLKSFLLENQKD